MKKALYWLPRILAIFINLFIALFALDVFGTPQWFIGLLIHLIPNYIITILTIYAWKHPWIGGILFVVGGIVFFAFTHFESAIICIPLILIGLLFMEEAYILKK